MLRSRETIRAITGPELRWRGLLFWILMLAAFQSLEVADSRRQIMGVVETLAFLIVAISSAGKLDGLGLEFTCWNAIGLRATVVSASTGFLAGGTIVMVALLNHRPLGAEHGLNEVILAVVLGPVIEEVVFRGYLLTAAILLGRKLVKPQRNWPSVVGVALIFMLAHAARPGTTCLQLCCIMITGTVYGFIRIRQKSTLAAALAHGSYNLALYLSFWIGLSS
jgi:membrane protease YdiL (CAAX protease family)